MDAALTEKLDLLRKRMRELRSVAVAFSAGVDSTLVLKVAREVLGPVRVLAVTGRSPSVPAAEVAEASELAARIGAAHIFLDTNEFADARYTSNPTNRCYFCKTTLYTQMEPLRAERGLDWIVNGTNADDLGDWRPGLKAADEHRVASPLAEAGLTKADVRELSRYFGLPTSDKPAGPCLSSRVPYGQEVTPAKLAAIEAGEAWLRRRFDVRECRVRHFGEFARLELLPGDIEAAVQAHDEIAQRFADLGFAKVEIDPRGFRSGSLNEVIAFGTRQ